MDPRFLDDDDQLLQALGEALAASAHPREALVRANAKDAFSLRDIESELAGLVYDSSRDEYAAAASRNGNEIQVVVFESDTISIQIEIIGNTVVGQIEPPGDLTVVVESPDRTCCEVEVDELGCFALTADCLAKMDHSPWRFQIQRRLRRTVTEWTHLPPSVS